MIVSHRPHSLTVKATRDDASASATFPPCYAGSLFVAALAALAAALGVAYEGTYHNTAFARAAFRGSDLVTLAVVLPGLVASAHLARRGSQRAHLVWLGALGYLTYTYAYIFAMGFSRLFLLYLAIASLSAFTLVAALAATDVRAIASRIDSPAPVRGISAFLWFVGGMLGIIELGQVISANIAGTVPDFVTKTGHPTGVVYILDLGAVVPLMLLGGAWLRARRPWGYVIAAILLVKGITVGLGLASANLFNYLDGRQTDGPLLGLWIAIAAGSLIAIVLFLDKVDSTEGLDVALIRPA